MQGATREGSPANIEESTPAPFLFNTLNSISALMLTNVEAADRMITRLGDLLRTSLDTAGTQMTT